MKPPRPMDDVRNDWAAQLSAKLGRSKASIRKDGLMAYDFSTSSSVEVRYPHGMTYRFNSAFAVLRPKKALAAVFSEHAGYAEFDLEDDCEVVELHEVYYRHNA